MSRLTSSLAFKRSILPWQKQFDTILIRSLFGRHDKNFYLSVYLYEITFLGQADYDLWLCSHD